MWVFQWLEQHDQAGIFGECCAQYTIIRVLILGYAIPVWLEKDIAQACAVQLYFSPFERIAECNSC